jgi:hypothetical protein
MYHLARSVQKQKRQDLVSDALGLAILKGVIGD